MINTQNNRYARVNIREDNDKKRVQIASATKPEIGEDVLEKWQSLLDITAQIMDVPSSLIMKLNEDTIEVFLKSQNKENPYKEGGEEKLVYGLYCETVIGKQEKLIVPDATKIPVWSYNNPDIELNMISYMGFPVNYPDGEVFGTVCVLDDKENAYRSLYEDLLVKVKNYIEKDLELLISQKQLKEKTGYFSIRSAKKAS